MMQALRILLTLGLIAGVGYLGYQLYKTIEEPILFEEDRLVRDEAGISKLKLIRQLQIAYRANTDTFADNFEDLIKFGKEGIISVEKIIGDPNDSTIVSRTEIFEIPVRDSILNKTSHKIEELANVPFSDKDFDIKAGMITKNDLEIPAFEVSTPYTVLYNGLIKKYYANKVGRSISVGSMKDGTTSGSWGS